MTTPDFQTFWNTYALKRDRIAAERAWKKLSARDRRAALAGIQPYTEACTAQGISRMYAQGYLSHRRWEDEPTAPTAPASASSPVGTPAPVRTAAELTDEDRQTFSALKADLRQAHSRHLGDTDTAAFNALMDDLALAVINDTSKTLHLHSTRYTFNRAFAVPYFWKTEDFDRIVAQHYPGYRWLTY